MKILIVVYPRFGLNKGGLQFQVLKTIEALESLGHQVVMYDPWQNQILDADILHVFSLDGTLLHHINHAKVLNVPVVLSPVFSCSGSSAYVVLLKRYLSSVPGIYSDMKRAYLMVRAADAIIALNGAEEKLVTQVFSVSNHNVYVVPNGIEPKFAASDPGLFYEKYGTKDFILQVGTIEPNKNQYPVIRAAVKGNFNLVVLGAANKNYLSYYDACVSASAKNVIFTGYIAHDDPLLASAYAAAKAFILPSFNEVMPLSLLEAAAARLPLLVSNTVPVPDELLPYVRRFNPRKEADVARAISSHNYDLRPTITMTTWRDVAKTITDVYSEVINKHV